MRAQTTAPIDCKSYQFRDAAALALFNLFSSPNKATRRVEKLPPDYPGAEPREIEIVEPWDFDLATVQVKVTNDGRQFTFTASGVELE